MKLRPIELTSLKPEIFRLFEEQPPLLTAGDRSSCNTMTIGWCQLGTLWHLPVCTVYVRPERYTYQFMEAQDYFTVSVLPESETQTIRVCGTKSGRDLDKIQECGLTLCYGAGDAPFFEEAELVLVCKKIFVQDMTPDCVVDGTNILPYYNATNGWHRIYTGQVVEAYMK